MSEDSISTGTPRQKSGRFISHAALLLALLAVAVSAWQWFDGQRQSTSLQQALTDRLSRFEQDNRESLAISKHAEDIATQSSAKTALLDEKLAASSAQQEGLQTLYRELANNRDEWTIAEVEQLLVIASHQLQLAGNVKSALLALQTADSRLQELNRPQIIQLRKAIEKDIQRLQAVPNVDVVSMSLKLTTLMEAVDKLPLTSDRHPAADNAAMPDWNSQPWRRLTQEIWHDLKNMVRIERVDHPEPPLLTPEQAYFLRENLRLRLLSARLALLQHDDVTYYADLRLIQDWVKRHFDTLDPATKSALETLQQLTASGITIEIPDISESLNAISKYKLSLERGKE